MRTWSQRGILALGVLLMASLLGLGAAGRPKESGPTTITLVVLDPLAKELACACVKGYGQRDYRKLAARLEADLKLRVAIEFSDDLAETLTSLGRDPRAIVIGEAWRVTPSAVQSKWKSHAVVELTGQDGDTTLTGLFVARADDSAKELKDIVGRKVFLGVAAEDDKQAAAFAAMRAAGVPPPAQPDQRASFSDAALDILDSSLTPPPVGVIPSYALPMLEGCGSVRPGNLKVIGKTKPSPFITGFLTDSIPPEKQARIVKALLGIKGDTQLLKALESRDGFKPIKSVGIGPKASREADWPDWRGPGRDGHVPRLPARLPTTAKFIWKKAAMTGGLAGLSISDKRLILAERDFSEEYDVYRCLNGDNGETIWRAIFPAKGTLDYGQSPRATPVIHQGKAYLLGAFGDLRCVNLANGKVIWERKLPREFKAQLPTWGMCATPLIVDDLLIVNPGGAEASLAALDCSTGRTRWTTPGLPAAYAAFICGEFGGRRQIVGYDQNSLGGWDVKTGERLWEVVPTMGRDFNVATPIAMSGGVVVATENNGTRLYGFDAKGKIIPKPVSESSALSPDTVTPVATCGRVFGAHQGLHCLDVESGLKPVWHRAENALGDHATLFADDERVLVVTLGGELILLDAMAPSCAINSRLRLFDAEVEVYSHPAFAGTRLYVRGGSSVMCVDLRPD